MTAATTTSGRLPPTLMTTRRDFLRTATGAAAVLAGGPALHLRSRADADIILRGGTVFDGTAAGREADVVITAERSRRSHDARRTGAPSIDARPGGGAGIHRHPLARRRLVVGGPRPSRSFARIARSSLDKTARLARPRVARVAARAMIRGISSTRFAISGARWPACNCPVNVASMVGPGTIRDVAVEETIVRRPRRELTRMERFVCAALADGVRCFDGPRVHAGCLRAARGADRAVQTACRHRTSVRDAHAQRRRPRARGNRRGDRRRTRRELRAPDLAPQDTGTAQLGKARRRVRACGGRARNGMRRRVRPLSVHRLSDGAHQSLSRLEPRRKQRGIPGPPG